MKYDIQEWVREALSTTYNGSTLGNGVETCQKIYNTISLKYYDQEWYCYFAKGAYLHYNKYYGHFPLENGLDLIVLNSGLTAGITTGVERSIFQNLSGGYKSNSGDFILIPM